MPTLVKNHADSKPASATKGNGLAVTVLLLAIAVAGALLSTFFPLPPAEVTAADIVPAPDPSFFGP